MTYPINEPAFVAAYLSRLEDPNEVARRVAEETVKAINRGYYKGLEDGMKFVKEAGGESVATSQQEEAAECRE